MVIYGIENEQKLAILLGWVFKRLDFSDFQSGWKFRNIGGNHRDMNPKSDCFSSFHYYSSPSHQRFIRTTTTASCLVFVIPSLLLFRFSQHSAARESLNKNRNLGISLVIQWLRLCTPSTGGTGLIPGLGTKIPHAMVWPSETKPTNHESYYILLIASQYS